MNMELSPELLFFDTFSHEANEDINLDLVQFPKPVYITEVRIIPLGARVQADFPGGVRLGATNPSKFGIEFFVNDLGKPGASSFEILGNLEYNQNNCIHLECPEDKIPTDGLVLRGWYSTITLAVYGTLTKNLAEQIASPQHTPNEPAPEIIEEAATESIIPPALVEVEPITIELHETGFEDPSCTEPREVIRPFSGGPHEESFYDSPSRDLNLGNSNRSEHEKRSRTYSDSNDREYNSSNASKKREWSRSPEYRHSRRRSDRSRRDSDTRGSSSDHKRPRTPPQLIDSPPSTHRLQSPDDNCEGDEIFDRQKTRAKSREKLSPESQPATSEPTIEESIEVRSADGDEISEQFEPILSDDEILGDDVSAGQDDDMDVDESEFENSIKVFDPFKMPINAYDAILKDTCATKILSIKKVIDKFQNPERYDQKEFLRLTVDEKENFVNLCELLVNNLMQTNLLSSKQRSFVVENSFKDENVLRLIAKILSVALNFECACSQTQPGYKIRHIKIGPRLVELILFSSTVLKYAIEKEHLDPFKYLFDLYHQDHMALSIKLVILRAMYSVLDSKFGVQTFLSNKANGYQQILLIMQNNPLTRLKFALKAIIKKVNLFEALETIRDLVTKHFVLTNHISNDLEDFQTLDTCIQEITHALNDNALSFQQPKRFLPSSKFEFHKDPTAVRSWSYMLQSYFREHALSESLLLILTNQNFVPTNVLTAVLDLLSEMAKCQVGIDYLVDYSFETTELIIKCLLGLEEEYATEEASSPPEKINEDSEMVTQSQENDESSPVEAMEVEEIEKTDEEKPEETVDNAKSDPLEAIKEKSPEIILPIRLTPIQKLGIEIAFKVQTRYHIDAITNNPTNVDILCEHLHALYSQTCSLYGRVHTTDVLGFSGNNLIPFLNLIEKERKIQAKRQLDSPGAKYKSPVLSYSVDLLDVFVRNCTNVDYLIDHGPILIDFVKNHDVFEPSVSAVLQEMAVYLKPLEIIDNFSYGGDINILSDLIKRSMEYITTFPGDLIMVLRILKHLTIGNIRDTSNETKELKLKYVLLQFYSADGVVTFLNILEKLNNYFEQPGLHAPTLMTIQGIQTCQVLLPVVQILKEMLTFVIECRDTNFKDVTAIEHLMKTYFLMHYFPERSQAYDDAQKIRSEIIKIFLAYTQPNEDEHIRGSLWTQMVREVIKCIRNGPSTFIPGLQVLAELLPLPLPLSLLKPLSNDEIQRLIVNRKLWSAHLHPESGNIGELIQTLCPTTFPQLLDLLTRVCLQLADLAPNMTLLVSKTICDMIVTECTLNCTDGIGTAHLARLLSFMAQLTCYAAVKISALSIFPGKVSETFLAILNKSDKKDTHILCQTSIHRIFENFFDSEISMLSTNNGANNLETNLANALPSKDLIPDIANAVTTSLLNSDAENCITALRNMIILTEHDITFYYLQQTLINKKAEFYQWILAIINSFENATDKMSSAITFVLFLRNLVIIDEPPIELTVPNRTLKLSHSELKNIILPPGSPPEENPLNKLKMIFESKNLEEEINEFENVIQDLKDLIEKLEDSNQMDRSEEMSPAPIEPNMQQAEGIVTQFLSRQVFTICENVDDVQLNSSYWLEPLRLEEIPEISDTDRVQCNLSEMISTCLPPETNLSSDCKRVLHLSASPQSNRERTATAPCFRTRRVEVEPQTGRPEKKKIYISPMRARGFQRAPPSRGDLFRSRPPNTSRPPSLHVDDFLALETCGAQPTGPTGYNKLSRDIIGIRGVRGGRNRPRIGIGAYRKVGSYPRGNYANVVVAPPPPQHFRTATSEPVVTPHFSNEQHPHFGGVPMRSRGRGRIRTFLR